MTARFLADLIAALEAVRYSVANIFVVVPEATVEAFVTGHALDATLLEVSSEAL